MPAARWRQAFDVLDRALELSPHVRGAYLTRVCGGNAALGADVAALLAGAGAPDFLDESAGEFAAPLLARLWPSHDTAMPGSQLGCYRILREIGRGGMGTVYLAERADKQYVKRVALKLLPRWSAGNERLVRRFLEERQILAALDHPDIAHLFDGGMTSEGLPWFAMEYVEGMPIDRYCEERGLTIPQRLELFCQVCAAVQYAHRNLVVHRDLKPANILVTGEGRVKLLDFGIAKLLHDDTASESAALTMTGERMLTPLYASPEQVRGTPISTASDIYSLGVVLFELLTGRSPYRLTTREPHEVAWVILEQEVERPSVAVLRPGDSAEGWTTNVGPRRLARRLRGDLDTIVGTAMHKDPARRYGTAQQLEADVRRHLARLPLNARGESRVSRAAKFVWRYRVGVAAAVGVALLILASALVTGVQAVRIRRQAVRIAAERDRAEQVSGFLAEMFQRSDPYAGGGSGLTAREILDSGAAQIDRELAEQPALRAQMMFEMGRAYFGLGLRDRARRFLELSLAIRRRALPIDSTEIARTLDVLGLVRLEQGELHGAERAYREALEIRRQRLGTTHREVARTLNGLAGALRSAGRFRDADSVSRTAIAIDETQREVRDLDLAESWKGLAHAVHERGDREEAARWYRRALALQQRSFGDEHPEVIGTRLDLADALGHSGSETAADSIFRHTIAVERRVLGEDHPEVARNEARYANMLHRWRAGAEAERLYVRSLTTMRRRLPAVHPLTSTSLLGLGAVLLERGELDRAEPLLREALGGRRTTLPRRHPAIAEAEQALGALIMARGRYVEAERYLLASYEGMRAAYGRDDRRTQVARSRLVLLYESAGQPARAASYRAEMDGAVPSARNGGADTQPTIDSTTVAVLPFRVEDASPSLRDLRDVVEDLLTARLTGEGGPMALDPPIARRARDRTVGGIDGDRPFVEALRLADRLGARWLLSGTVSGTTQRISLHATLVPVPTAVPAANASVDGSVDSLPYLVDRLLARLLAFHVARDFDELSALTRASPPAVRAYLGGLHAHRRGRAGVASEATVHFERALFLDSTFALAALRLVEMAAMYGTSEMDARWTFDAIWSRQHRLGPADRALLAAYIGPRYPRPATLSELIAAGERATAAGPHRAEAWRVAGENLMRFGSMVGSPRWEIRAVESLMRAHRLDPAQASTIEHLLLLAARANDTTAVKRYARLHAARHSLPQQGQFTGFMRWLTAAMLGDSAGLREVRRSFADMPRVSLRSIVDWSQALGVGLDDAERAAILFDERAASAAHRRSVMMAIVPYLLNRGRPDDARRLLAAADRGFGLRADVGVLEFRIHAALYWDGDSSDAAAAVRLLESYLAGASLPLGQSRDRQTAACALAHWRFATGDFAGTMSALRTLRRSATMGGGYSIESTPMCAASVEAQLAVAQNRRDAASALERLDTLLRAGADVQLLLPQVANLVAARIYESRGDLHRALALTRRRAFWWNQLLSTQLREEGRLAASVGERAAAVRAYRHYLALRDHPEPRLRPEVERVRRELERLTDHDTVGR